MDSVIVEKEGKERGGGVNSVSVREGGKEWIVSVWEREGEWGVDSDEDDLRQSKLENGWKLMKENRIQGIITYISNSINTKARQLPSL